MLLSIVSTLAWLICTGFGVALDTELDATYGLPPGSIALLFLFLVVTMLASLWFLRPERQAEPPRNPYQYMVDLESKTESFRKLRRRQY
jgi:hypothetical protein